MLKSLKEQVCQANLDLVREGLVFDTWGNASGIDRKAGLVVIKPSGVPYTGMTPDCMAVVELKTGRVVESELKPSSDTPTHLLLYRHFKEIGGIVHTHSFHATAWAQACRHIPALGTTHADYFFGPVPCTRQMQPDEIRDGYETNTARVIIETFGDRDPMTCPAVLVASHGPFVWGKTPGQAARNAAVLEAVARMASETLKISPSVPAMQQVLLEKHFFRKHGAQAYYGQAGERAISDVREKH